MCAEDAEFTPVVWHAANTELHAAQVRCAATHVHLLSITVKEFQDSDRVYVLAGLGPNLCHLMFRHELVQGMRLYPTPLQACTLVCTCLPCGSHSWSMPCSCHVSL